MGQQVHGTEAGWSSQGVLLLRHRIGVVCACERGGERGGENGRGQWRASCFGAGTV
jgi:hypothetical protein